MTTGCNKSILEGICARCRGPRSN